MLKTLFKSIKKSRQLKKVSKELAKPLEASNILNALSHTRNRKHHLDELIKICKSDESVELVMLNFGASEETLKDIYSNLLNIGAGQYAGGHYVAASSLAYPLTLKFLLSHYKEGSFEIRDYDEINSAMFIAYRLIEYFERGETGEVEY
jgi:hypothetical protein